MNKNDGDGDDDDDDADDADDAGSGGGGSQQQRERESGREGGREEDEDRLFERQLILRSFSPFSFPLPSIRVVEEKRRRRRRRKKTRLCRCRAVPLSVNCMSLVVDCRLELISAGDQPSESKGEWVKTFSVYSRRCRRRRRRTRLSSEKRPWNV